MFQAVIASCWPSGVRRRGRGVGDPIQRGDVRGLVDPDPARRDRHGVRDRIPARHGHHRVEADGDPVAGEEDGDHAQLGEPGPEQQEEVSGAGTRAGGRGSPRPEEPSPTADEACARTRTPRVTISSPAPARMPEARTGWSDRAGSSSSNDPATEANRFTFSDAPARSSARMRRTTIPPSTPRKLEPGGRSPRTSAASRTMPMSASQKPLTLYTRRLGRRARRLKDRADWEPSAQNQVPAEAQSALVC